jgi:hypothetical protein
VSATAGDGQQVTAQAVTFVPAGADPGTTVGDVVPVAAPPGGDDAA